MRLKHIILFFITFPAFVFFVIAGRVFAFSLPNAELMVGDTVFIDNVDSAHFYAVFLPFESPTNGDICASITGEELAQDNNLRHYGTCFINDPGVFTIIELGEPVHASYWDTKSSDYFIGQKTVTLTLTEAEQNASGVALFIENLLGLYIL